MLQGGYFVVELELEWLTFSGIQRSGANFNMLVETFQIATILNVWMWANKNYSYIMLFVVVVLFLFYTSLSTSWLYLAASTSKCAARTRGESPTAERGDVTALRWLYTLRHARLAWDSKTHVVGGVQHGIVFEMETAGYRSGAKRRKRRCLLVAAAAVLLLLVLVVALSLGLTLSRNKGQFKHTFIEKCEEFKG